jgi:hypothetical protein
VRKVAIFVGFYVVLALAIGIAYAWSWAAVVILFGLIPAGAAWFMVGRFSESHLDWDQGQDRYR